MREPHEIRRQILRIRDRNKLTTNVICERARVTRAELISCFNMAAREETLRRLDAYLDAPKLHERDRAQTLLAHNLDRLSREVWREFRMPTPHPMTLDRMSHDQQKRVENSITARAKAALQRKILKEHGIVVKVPDGATYWQYKERCLHRIRGEEAIRTGDRDSHRVPWPRPIREERSL